VFTLANGRENRLVASVGGSMGIVPHGHAFPASLLARTAGHARDASVCQR
jgi:hypothetical protein